MTDLLPPPIPPEVDLRDYPWVPINRRQLFQSTFHRQCKGPLGARAWKAGVTLWLMSLDEQPAGSLPKEDYALCEIVGLGEDLKTWRSIKDLALHGWSEHSDGRLYHPVVTKNVLEQWARKQEHHASREAGRERKRKQRERERAQDGHADVTREDAGVTRDISPVSRVTPQETDRDLALTRTETRTRTEEEGGAGAPPDPSPLPFHEAPEDKAHKAYLDLAIEMGLPQSELTRRRRPMVRACLQRIGGLARWRAALDRVREIPALCGMNDRRWKIDLEWLAKDDNLTKLLEGKYDDWHPVDPDAARPPSGRAAAVSSLAAGFAAVAGAVGADRRDGGGELPRLAQPALAGAGPDGD